MLWMMTFPVVASNLTLLFVFAALKNTPPFAVFLFSMVAHKNKKLFSFLHLFDEVPYTFGLSSLFSFQRSMSFVVVLTTSIYYHRLPFMSTKKAKVF